MTRSLPRVLVSLTIIALLLAACSSSEDTDPGPPPTPAVPVQIDDLTVTAGSAASVTLRWTSPALGDKATIAYDLRHVPYGSEGADWDAWTVAAPPESDTSSGQVRTHEVTGLVGGQVYAFGLAASSGGTEWSEPSNTVVATAAPNHDTTAPTAVTRLILFNSTANSLTMVWPEAGDDGVHGRASGYLARYATEPITAGNWANATPVPGQIVASDLAGMMETVITGLAADQEFHVAVVALDEALNQSALSNVVAATTVNLNTIYVNVEGTGDYPTIEAAINDAEPGDLILVGPGRYTWTNQATGDSLLGLINVPRDYTDFEVRSTAGPAATILDAELHGKVFSVTGGSFGDPDDLDYAGITIDGFTFTKGRALATEPNPLEGWSGAGLNLHLSDSVVRNCIFVDNEAYQGGGLWVGGQGDAIIENCLFENNRASYGGAIMLVNSEPRITVRDCTIRDNSAVLAGGGIFAFNVLATLENLLITRNLSADKGGGISVSRLQAGSLVDRCTVADNQADWGSAIRFADNSILEVRNSLLAFNSGSRAFSSAVQSTATIGCTLVWGHDEGNELPFGFTDLGGNLELDPLFCNRSTYLLQAGSPCLPENHPEGPDCGIIGARGVGCSP